MVDEKMSSQTKVDKISSSLITARNLRLPVWYRWHAQAWKFLTVVLQLDLIYNMHQMWNHFVLRLLTIKELNSTFFGIMGYIGMYDSADLFTYVESHVARMDERHRAGDTKCSTTKQRILDDRDTQLKRSAFAVSFLFGTLFFLCALVPYAQTFQKIVQAYLHDVTLGKDVSMIVYTYYPESFQTIPLYTLFHNLLFFWYSSIVYLWAMDLRAVLMAFECLNAECELLVASIEEDLASSAGEQLRRNDLELRRRLRLIVIDHQEVCRNTRILDKYSRNILMGFMNVYGVQLCLILIFIMEIEEAGPRLRYLFRYCMVLSLMYVVSSQGQSVTDRGFAVRTALANSPWIDKPKWFKETLLIMLTRTTRELLIKPYGLYTINMNCIANIVKGSYTYMNLVNNFRKKN